MCCRGTPPVRSRSSCSGNRPGACALSAWKGSRRVAEMSPEPVERRGIPVGEFDKLVTEVAEWVRGPGEDWATTIEQTGEVGEALWTELRERGYLSMAAPKRLGGTGLS